MKRLCVVLLITTVISIVAMGKAFGQSWPDACEGKPPHYLVGFTRTSDQVDAFIQVQQNYQMSLADSRLPSARWGSNLGESVQLTFYGHTLTLYLPMYRKSGNAVHYYSAAGVTSLTVQEFECVKEDLRDWIQRGVDGDYADHQMITKIAVESFAAQNKMTPDAVRALLSKSIPEYGTNYADVLKIPLLEPADFIKGVKHIYFTSMRSCNAWVSLQTIVAFSPCMRRWDYILGFPTVVKHELIHANAKLQGYPIGWYNNSELFAALLPFLEQPTDIETFLYHGYLEAPWEMLLIYGRFDVERVRREFYSYRVYRGGSAVNREVIANYLSEMNKAATWLRESGLKVLGKFYSDPHVWVAVNDMSHDDTMAYRVIMAGLYEPTLLGGHANTIRFILKHANQSKDVANAAWERVGKSRNIMDARRQKIVDEYSRLAEGLGISKEELMRIGRAYGLRSEHLEHMDIELVRMIFNDFLTGQGPFRKSPGVR